jgi:hypothetical protein
MIRVPTSSPPLDNGLNYAQVLCKDGAVVAFMIYLQADQTPVLILYPFMNKIKVLTVCSVKFLSL